MRPPSPWARSLTPLPNSLLDLKNSPSRLFLRPLALLLTKASIWDWCDPSRIAGRAAFPEDRRARLRHLSAFDLTLHFQVSVCSHCKEQAGCFVSALCSS